jgi:hypothetical protein
MFKKRMMQKHGQAAMEYLILSAALSAVILAAFFNWGLDGANNSFAEKARTNIQNKFDDCFEAINKHRMDASQVELPWADPYED